MKVKLLAAIIILTILTITLKSQEVDTTYRMLYGHDYVNPDKRPYLDNILEVKWSLPIKTQFKSPFIVDGIIFLYDNIEYAIDGSTGKKLYFDSKIAQRHFRKVMKDSLICFGKLYNTVCYNLFNGEKYFIKKSFLNESIYIARDSLIFVYKDNKEKNGLIAYNFISQETCWEFPYKPRFQYMTILENRIIIGDVNFASCINIKTGKELWQIDNVDIKSNIVINGNETYCITRSNGLLVLDSETGNTIYNLKEPYLKTILRSGNTIYFYRTEDYVAFDMERKEILWRIKGHVGFESGLNIFDNYILTYDDEIDMHGEIVAVNKNNGKIEYKSWGTDRFTFKHDESDESWEIKQGNSTFFFSEEWNNSIYATCSNDSIYCFQVKEIVRNK